MRPADNVEGEPLKPRCCIDSRLSTGFQLRDEEVDMFLYYMFLGPHGRRPEGRGKELVLFRMLIRVHLEYYTLDPSVVKQVRFGKQFPRLGRGAVDIFERLDGCE